MRGHHPVLVAGCVATVAIILALLASCTSKPSDRPAETATTTVVETLTRPPLTPKLADTGGTVTPLPPSKRTPKGEVEGRCPYIAAGVTVQPTSAPNIADIEGDHVYRSTRLTRFSPVGCRFYFYASPYEAVADIRPFTYGSAKEAYAAMIERARLGSEQITERNFSGSLTGICFRTPYFGPDGAKDWAFTFAKGRHMVVVYTQRNDTSRNALYIAQAIAKHF